IARLVALIDSIRPTVRRVTRTLATPATTNINATQEITAILIWSAKLSRSLISLPTSKRLPPGNVSSIARSSGGVRALGYGHSARNSVHPLAARTVDGHALRLPARTANEGSA